ncbi:MAG: tail protein X [Aliarcobacter sp.]|nr:tail protein X [Aliarcobacter sp.]
MKELTAKNGERLDEIVFREYGTLDFFEKVLSENQKLSKKIFLDESDIIYLPEIMIVSSKKQETLW